MNDKKGKITFRLRQLSDSRCLKEFSVEKGDKTFAECKAEALESFKSLCRIERFKHVVTHDYNPPVK
jgi:hypothetical protein